MISQEEMRRINIEASSNLARLLQLWNQNEDTFFDRLRRAYEQLPMPQRRVKRNREPLEMILGFLIGIHKTGERSLPANAPTAVSHPYAWSLTERSSQIRLKQEWTVHDK